MTLRISNQRAQLLLEGIPHQSCQKAIASQWRVTTEGQVAAQSVLWLFCWAKTGMNSRPAAETARTVFNALFDVDYMEFDSRIPHSYARTNRYTAGDIEAELVTMLAG